eukprot:5057726-Pyramimonas_sp.AAC.1
MRRSKRRRRKRRRRRRTNVNARLINDVGIHLSSKVFLHRLYKGSFSTDNLVIILKRGKTPSPGLQRHKST